MAHGDYLDFREYIVKSHDLSADADSLKKFAMEVPSTMGGGNGGEVTLKACNVIVNYIDPYTETIFLF